MKYKTKIFPSPSAEKLFLISLFVLIIGHLMINTFFHNIIINIIGLMIVSIIIFQFTLAKRDFFGFLMIIYICSHFSYADNQGGVFNLIAFVLMSVYFANANEKEVMYIHKKIYYLLVIFLISNFVGLLLKNPNSLYHKIIGGLSFLGYIFVFYQTSHIIMTPSRIKKFIKITIFLVIYSFLTSINTYFGFYKSNSPMIGSEARFQTEFIAGMLGWSEISGEHALLVIVIIFPFLFSGLSKKLLNLNGSLLMLSLFFSLINLFLTRSRSVFILLIIYFAVVFIIFIFSKTNVFNKKITLLPKVLSLVILVLLISSSINLKYLMTRFDEVNLDANIEEILSGDEINREYAYSFAFNRFKQNNWMIGYGWGSTLSNRTAWFNNPDTPRSGYHSLYLSLPPLFGWIGSAIFILLMLYILYEVLKANIQVYKFTQEIRLLSFGFLFLLIFFLINEYKIEAVRDPNYFMIIWIWFGLALSSTNVVHGTSNK